MSTPKIPKSAQLTFHRERLAQLVVARAEARHDAWIRGWRTLVQGLLLDVSVTVTLFLVTVIGDLEWTRTYWAFVGLGVARSVIHGIVSYFARKLIKPANVTN